MVFFHISEETGDQDGEVSAVKRDGKSRQDSEREETPPPLPPRRRHAETADEPETKKSRTGELGMALTLKHSIEKKQ